jgi:hypothetical protein
MRRYLLLTLRHIEEWAREVRATRRCRRECGYDGTAIYVCHLHHCIGYAQQREANAINYAPWGHR